jgi:hypothetical protein
VSASAPLATHARVGEALAAVPVSYPVRTPPLYWAVVGVLAVIAAFGAIAFVLGLARGDFGLIDILALLLAVVPVAYIVTTAEYRATGAIQLAVGEVLVPDPRGRPLTFRAPGLRIAATHVHLDVRLIHIPVARVQRGVVLEFADAFQRRRLSTLTLVQPEHREALLADLDRVLRGEPPLGHVPARPTAPSGPKSELEAQLDRELAALD